MPGSGPVEALRGVTFAMQRGELLAVMGPSGAGKTTLCLALCALVPHSTGGTFGGNVVVQSRNTRSTLPAEMSAHVGVVFQDPESQLFTTIVEDEVAFALESQGLPREEIGRRVDWALERVRMTEHRHRNPAYLSGGQKQRVAIAAAIAPRPELLVLDEPTASLDPVGAQEVIQVLADLRRDLDSSVLVVTHDAELAGDFADRLLLLKEGHIGYDGPPAQAFQDPALLAEYAIRPPALAELSAWLTEHGRPARFHTFEQASEALSRPLTTAD